jgi:general secretion pathway protein G
MNCKEPLHYSQLRLKEGYSLVELLICIAIIMTIAALAVPNYIEMVNTAKVMVAIGDIKQISTEISAYNAVKGTFPNSLDDIRFGDKCDPWGRPYQYLKTSGKKKGESGGVQKDKTLVPINSDYDLYSFGKDGSSAPPLTAKHSQGEIIRANNGEFIGLARDY